MITIRCSQLPIIVRCQGMLEPGYTAVNPVSAVADAGTDIHARLAHHVRTGTLPSSDDPEMYLWTRLCQACLKMGVDVYEMLPENELSCSLTTAVQIKGHPDYWFVPVGEATGYLLDVKSGWKGGEGGREDLISLKHAEQVIGYAWCIFTKHPALEHVKAAIVPKLGPIQYETWSRVQVMNWAEDVRDLLREWDGQFKPGDHCQYCVRRFDCPGLRQMERASVEIVTDEGRLHDLTDPATQVDLWRKAKIVIDAGERLQSEIRKHLPLLTKGQIENQSGNPPIYLTPTTKRIIDPVEAWAVLVRELGDDGLAQCVTIGLQRLEVALKAKAERGLKQIYLKWIFQRLEDRGALQFVPGANRVVINKEEEDNAN